ncbi:uncharacterized protein [Coffea arabica]|uniref:WRC domain-containing protein n=1 Tax=Coffea arabica TaxID=13443 RepID=A0A6P6SNF1_COFAR|nr:uncharacterized protein LOC113693004 [Coffea arabica]
MRWAPPSPPPDLQSSTSVLWPLKPLPHTINHPSQQLPSTKSSVSFPQVDDDDEQQLMATGSIKENKAAGVKSSAVVGAEQRSYLNRSAEANNRSLPSCFSRRQVSIGGHWLEEDKIFPLKKRRILDIMDCVPSSGTGTVFQRELKNGGNTRASGKRTEKKWADHVTDYEHGDDLEWIGGANGTRILAAGNMKSSSTRGSSQRCRRENGHGWRCPQPSLAGYYVCEHHWELNKSRETKKKKKKKKKEKIIARKFADHHDQPTYANKFTVLFRGTRSCSSDTEDSDDDHVLPKKRIGVVKDRSISSLLSS